MSAAVVQLRASAGEQLLTKKQLAAHLGRSTRWVELRAREGLPSLPPTQRYPHRRYRLADVEAWLAAGPPKPVQTPSERITQLEEQVARLSATIEEIQRRVR